MKKILTSLIIVILLFQTIISPNIIYAVDSQTEQTEKNEEKSVKDDIMEMVEEGTGTKGDREDYEIDRQVDGGNIFSLESNTMKSIITMVFNILNFIPISISTVMSIAVMDFTVLGEEVPNFFTIEDLVFGKISVLDINFLSNQNIGTTQNGVELNKMIKESKYKTVLRYQDCFSYILYYNTF